MMRTRKGNQDQQHTRGNKANNRMDRGRKGLFGLAWFRGREAKDAWLETVAEQLETLSKIDWSRYRSG